MKKIFCNLRCGSVFPPRREGICPAMPPGMSAVEIKANMADGFYTGKSRDCGYDLG